MDNNENIFVTLPDVMKTSNYIDVDSYRIYEDNNIGVGLDRRVLYLVGEINGDPTGPNTSTTELINTINKKDDFINELKQEMDESYNRGVAFARQESATLEEENTELKRQLGEKADQIDSMINLYKRAKNIQDTMEQMQKIDTMPVLKHRFIIFTVLSAAIKSYIKAFI